jgi:peptide deformylase
MSDVKPIDGVFRLNTSDALVGNVKTTIEPIETFNLVSPDNTILRQVMPEFDFNNKSVDANKFASTLVETCKKNNGIGLSANQCGFPYRVFVMGSGDDYVAHFNPELVSVEGESHMVEGCLSFPLLGLHITRPAEIVVSYQDFHGEKRTAKYVGISARCFLHELDHMNGIVYTDRVKPMALQSGLDKRNKIMRKMSQMQALMMKQAKQKNVKTNSKRS